MIFKKLSILMGVGLMTYLSTLGQTNLVQTQAALTAPTFYDISFKHDVGYGEYILTGTDSYFGFPAFNRVADSTYFNYDWDSLIDLIDGDPLAAILDQHQGLSFAMSFNRSNTNWSVGSGTFAGKYFAITEPIGSDNTVGTNISNKVYLKFQNNTKNDYRLILDVSSTSDGVAISNLESNDDNLPLSYFVRTSVLNYFTIPSYSTIEVYFNPTTGSRYFNAWYLSDLGLSDSYDNGFQDGYIDGEEDGYEDGLNNNPNILLSGFQAMVGILVNFALMVLNLSVFGVSLLDIFAIMALLVGVIWILKLVRG
jgi:hypothetical protein